MIDPSGSKYSKTTTVFAVRQGGTLSGTQGFSPCSIQTYTVNSQTFLMVFANEARPEATTAFKAGASGMLGVALAGQ
jgi:hypothetical protein